MIVTGARQSKSASLKFFHLKSWVLWQCCCTGKPHHLRPVVKAESQLFPERYGHLPTEAPRTISEWTCAALHAAIILVWALPSPLSALPRLKCLSRPKGLYLSVSRHSSKCILLPNIKSFTEGKKSKKVSQSMAHIHFFTPTDPLWLLFDGFLQ